MGGDELGEGTGGRQSGCASWGTAHRATENMMRYLAPAVLILLSAISSSSFAQGHMGTPQEQQACRRDASRFCRQQL